MRGERVRGKVRVCDRRCHKATKPDCDCWCGGMFHGAKGEAARQAFREVWGEEIPRDGEPAQLPLGGAERWRAALQAAAATTPAPPSVAELAHAAWKVGR